MGMPNCILSDENKKLLKDFIDSEIPTNLHRAVQDTERFFFHGACILKDIEIKKLTERLKLAERCMYSTWGNAIIPNGHAVVAPLRQYRNEYPEALK